MMNAADAVLVTLATARVTKLITEDEITSPIRERVSALAFGKPVGHPLERVSYLITCPRCVSVWAGAACIGLSRAGKAGRALLGTLAASQAALAVLDLQSRAEEK